MYAIIQDGSKQFKVEQGKDIFVDFKGDKKSGEAIEFSQVLLIADNDNIDVGFPFLKNVKVTGEVINHLKDKKIRVYKYKRREGYHRTVGHRQIYTHVRVKEIIRS